jgi:hypothetical protein
MDTEDYAPFSLADEARAWIADVVPNVDDVEEATDAEVIEWVRRNYEGGLMAFAADAMDACGFGVMAATLRDAARIDEDGATRRCDCVCGCDYSLDGYAWSEDVCGACFNLCD